MRETDDPRADEITEMMLSPPSRDDAITDAEERVFAGCTAGTRCAGPEMIAADRETFLVAVTGHSHVRRSAHDLVAARLEDCVSRTKQRPSARRRGELFPISGRPCAVDRPQRDRRVASPDLELTQVLEVVRGEDERVAGRLG